MSWLYKADDDVPVLVPFAIVGEAGEDISELTSPIQHMNSLKIHSAITVIMGSTPEVPSVYMVISEISAIQVPGAMSPNHLKRRDRS